MKDNYTHILFIIDDSGSMGSVLDDSIGGFNSFLKEQQKLDGECRMHTMIFGSNGAQNYIHEDQDVNDISELTKDEHGARSGMTALLDSIGKSIVDLGKFLKDKDKSERPSKVLVNVFTDGHENDSIEFSKDKIEELIKEQTDKYNWEFAFLASDLSASNLAKSVGISNVALAKKGSKGMKDMYTSMTLNASSVRSRGVSADVQALYDAEDAKEESSTT